MLVLGGGVNKGRVRGPAMSGKDQGWLRLARKAALIGRRKHKQVSKDL